jgi:hypothetical protein
MRHRGAVGTVAAVGQETRDTDMSERDTELRRASGISRRELIRRGAIVGGTLLWAAPAVQTLTPAAYAQQPSPGACGCCYCWNGDKQNPGPPNPGQARADLCTDDGCTGFLATPGDCAAFCDSTFAPGGPFANSEQCCGTTCICNTADDPGLNGCTCS